MVSTGVTQQLTTPPCGLAPGELLAGRFLVDAPVGWGGQAVVWRATDQASGGTSLAIKALRQDLPPAQLQEAADLLRWEGLLLRRLVHPGLPRLLRIHEQPAQLALVRELVPGIPLARIAAQGPSPAARVREWALQLCDLLIYLHSCAPPVIVGDLKPGNLILRPDGTLALIDLGAAQTLTRRPPRKPRPRHGTPGYAPPEQLGNWGLDERCDIFALAATCYGLLTGLDPGAAPLQFDLQRLEAVAPALAPALRAALALDPTRRTPTAATLRAALGAPPQTTPLKLGFGAQAQTRRDLPNLALRHPRLLEDALNSGNLERWLARHPDAGLGNLLHELRATRRTNGSRTAGLDLLLSAMAPAEGAALQVSPARLVFPGIPLRHWRLWSPPLSLSLRNPHAEPQRWELECLPHPAAELRVLVNGKPLRRADGVIAPGAKIDLALVAAGRSGLQQGQLIVRCGGQSNNIDWEGRASAGIPLAGRFITRIEELDLGVPDLLDQLEQLLNRGALRRWLVAINQRALAAELSVPESETPTAFANRLRLAALLHRRDPQRFPLLKLNANLAPAEPLIAGERSQIILTLQNLADQRYLLRARSETSWLHMMPPSDLAPQSTLSLPLQLNPPPNLRAGLYSLPIELRIADLPLQLSLHLQVIQRPWWQRALRWLTGGS